MEQPCPINTHLCVNTHGSYSCHELSETTGCPAGFKYNAFDKKCQGKINLLAFRYIEINYKFIFQYGRC